MTKPNWTAIALVATLATVAVYAAVTDDQDLLGEVERICAAAAIVAAAYVAMRHILRRRGTPIDTITTYPCGADKHARAYELAGLTYSPDPVKAGCPTHGARCVPKQDGKGGEN